MRKFLTFLAAVVISLSACFAQETVITKPAALDNNYVNLTVGTQSNTNDLVKDLYPELNLYLGHQFNPVWGVELNGEMTMHRKFASTPTWVASSYVGLAGTLNMNNLISGYKGKARGFEVVPFVGIGWLHTYGAVSNAIATKMGVDMRVALNKSRSLQLNVRPTIGYALTGHGTPGYDINYSRTGLEVGVMYHFKNKDGNHNFTQKEVVDYDQYLALNEEVNKLRSQGPRVIKETIVVTNEVTNAVEVFPAVNVGFSINSSVISYTQMANIVNVADMLANDKCLVAEIHGYADKDTGTAEYNMGLSERRAEAVKDALVELGVDPDRIRTYAEGSCSQVYDENNWNRVAVITVK